MHWNAPVARLASMRCDETKRERRAACNGGRGARPEPDGGAARCCADQRGGQGFVGLPSTGSPSSGVDNAYAPFSVKAQMMLRSYSV